MSKTEEKPKPVNIAIDSEVLERIRRHVRQRQADGDKTNIKTWISEACLIKMELDQKGKE